MSLILHKLNILVVEDTLPMQRLLASVLESLGHKPPLLANNGIQGFEMFRKFNPDIVITDWLMEPGDGLELTRKIRGHTSSPNVMAPVILITGYGSMQHVQEARDAGVTEFLVKPFTALDVSKRIAHVINNPRDFVSLPDYFGPDRRRRKGDQEKGPRRRNSERKKITEDTWMV